MTLVDTLRLKCAQNGLGVSGSASVLFERLKMHEKKKKKCASGIHAHTPAKKTLKKKNVVTPGKTVAFKGARLSAAYYFHTVCDGKISRCSPQVITDNNGHRKLKEIKIVNGKTGKHPIWVLVRKN